VKHWLPTQVHHVHKNFKVEFPVIFQPEFESLWRWIVCLAVMAELLDFLEQLFIYVVMPRMFEQPY
jgi:hypothetical protein